MVLYQFSLMQARALLNYKNFSFFINNTKQNNSLAGDWSENTKSSFKEEARNFSKNLRKYQNFNNEKKTAKLTQKRKLQTRN